MKMAVRTYPTSWRLSACLLTAATLVAHALPAKAQETFPEYDDASLRSVFFTSPEHGCVVGTSGAIWTTEDAGTTWTFRPSPVQGLHESVTFVNRRVGWIVGSRTMPSNGIPLGYVLRTEDGGATWQLVAGRPTRSSKPNDNTLTYLPRLRSVRFFTPTTGFAIGASNPSCRSGVLKTTDGGETWEAVPGQPGDWRCGWFLNPETGFVAGRMSQRGLITGARVVPAANPVRGPETWRAVRLSSTQPGWIVGDGASVLTSRDAGITWAPPPTPLPRGLRDFADFHAVATAGPSVWIAGSPGSVIWHSPDAGVTWRALPTSQTAPIRALFFRDASNGWAVGDLGCVLRTQDGGQSWTPLRGGGRRVALLASAPRAARVPFAALAVQSGEHGYRSAVIIPSRPDGPADASRDDSEDTLREAVTQVFGCVAEYDWRFAVVVAGADRVDNRLVATWQRQTEGRLGQVLLSMLVARLRTYRPDVVVLDEVAEDDAVARLTNQAMLRAIQLAADPAQFVTQIRFAGLKPWTVKRVYQRVPANSRAPIELHEHDVLRLRGGMLGSVAGPALSLVTAGRTGDTSCGFRRLHPDAADAPARGDFFRGLSLAPGSEARRALVPYRDTQESLLADIAQRQRNFRGYMNQFLADERKGAQVLGQLNELTRGMPDAVAARQLRQLAEEYSTLQKWDLAAATMKDLVKRYPNTPEASNARVWLMRWWGAAEPTWQRERRSGIRGRIRSTGVQPALATVEPPDPEAANRPPIIQPAASTEPPVTFAPMDVADGQSRHRDTLRTNWNASAMKMSGDLAATDPLRFQQSSMQMAIASLFRVKGNRSKALAIYGRHDHQPEWQKAAAAELWLDQQAGERPDSVLLIRKAAGKPVLDAVLSDACWQDAQELWLRGQELDTAQGSFAAMAWDDTHLYLAGVIRRHATTSHVESKRTDRTYDAELGVHDRVTWYLDIDRDYATWYRLEVDQRGFTTDTCWTDRNWNPKWFVAIDSDATHWRFEAAIPLEELTPSTPARREAWAIGVRRMLPGYGISSWNRPASETPAPGRFGIGVFSE